MKLRKWQSECVALVLNKYASINQHFLCLATPGAGKTTMAAEVAALLFEENRIDFVLCFSPSTIVSNDIRNTMEQRTKKRFDGLIGAGGGSFNYQGMSSLNNEIWALLKSHRVFVIFDEIHHCSGTSIDDANAWGLDIINNIQGYATYTLALTGTPWRSDNTPIALAEYQVPDYRVLCDYVYGLSDAVRDRVCRTPQIVVTDNDNIRVEDGSESVEAFKSFSELLDETLCPYQKIIENETVIRHIVHQANNKLTEIRKETPNAGGLVVASTVAHATKILNILHDELNVAAVIATCREIEPTTIITDFKEGVMPWIVSVGMVSEGTNIPRLQVCCHLTRIKTELHFRQILGRILRMTHSPNQEACLFMPAEKTLIEYAYRVAEDIPDANAVVRFENSKSTIYIDEYSDETDTDSSEEFDSDYQIMIGASKTEQIIEISPDLNKPSLLSQTYEATLNIYGRFQQDILAVDVSLFNQ